MKFLKILFLLLVFSTMTMAEESSVSVMVKSPEEIQRIQKELEQMKNSFGKDHAAIDDLMSKASQIYEMNSRCASISISEMLDQSCVKFYEVDLPAFEEKYMEVTGEVRLNAVKMTNDLNERVNQLGMCTDALFNILVPYEQLFKLSGKIKLEPIDDLGNFEASYNYQLRHDQKRMKQQKKLATKWISKCGSIVMREEGFEFAPYFINKISEYNSRNSASGKNMVVYIDEKGLLLSVDMLRPAVGVFLLNGHNLFDATIEPDSKPHLRINMREEVVSLPLGENALIREFKDRKEIYGAHSVDLYGSWTWMENTEPPAGPDYAAQEESSSSEYNYDSSENYVTQDAGSSSSSDMYESAFNENWDMNSDFNKGFNPEDSKKDNTWSTARIGILAGAGALFVGGTILAAVANSKAKSLSEEKPSSEDEYNKNHDDIGSYQTSRGVGIGLAIVGAIGIGVSFAF